MEARDEKRLLRLQKQLAKYHLLIIDELGFVPLSKTGAELLFEVFSQRYGGARLVTTCRMSGRRYSAGTPDRGFAGPPPVHILDERRELVSTKAKNGGNPHPA